VSGGVWCIRVYGVPVYVYSHLRCVFLSGGVSLCVRVCGVSCIRVAGRMVYSCLRCACVCVFVSPRCESVYSCLRCVLLVSAVLACMYSRPRGASVFVSAVCLIYRVSVSCLRCVFVYSCLRVCVCLFVSAV
jgi:hypothetical protein